MKTIYMDMTMPRKGAFGVIAGENEILIPVGTTLYTMPPSDRGEIYTDFEQKYGIRFLFDDDHPVVDFYTVPWVEIAAMDTEGGFIGSLNANFDLCDDVTLLYISKDRQCFLLTENGAEFVALAPRWRECLRPFEGVTVYDSMTDARRELDIQTLEQVLGEKMFRQICEM